MQGDCETDLERLMGEHTNLRHQSAGRDRDVTRSDTNPPGCIDDSDGTQQTIVVRQRLTHSHEYDVVDVLTALPLDSDKLFDNLICTQIAFPAFQTTRAKLAAVRTTDLGRDANGAPIGGRSIKRGRRRD